MSKSCAFAVSFYTGSQSEHVNRGASIVCRKGNGEAIDVEHKNYLPILYYLTMALSNIPFYWGSVTRAIALTNDEINSYKEGDIVTWFQFASSNKGKHANSSFSHRNCYFHIYSLTGRPIKQFSNFPTEDEVLFLPYSSFLVITKERTKDKTFFHLRQIEIGLTSKSILWVDDHIFDEGWENKDHMEFAAAKSMSSNVHFIPKNHTQTAIAFLRSPFGQRLKNKPNFRIISDMKRTNENPSQNAGARFIKELRDLGFNNQVLIFTSDKQNADTLIKKECKNPGDVAVTIVAADVHKFVDFS